MQEKFLTVYAVFDDDTQAILHSWQDKISESGLVATYSNDIPFFTFHISLGSFAVDCEKALKERLSDVCGRFAPFEIELNSIQTFGSRVLYLEPSESRNLMQLHDIFDSNYADGLPYVPHATMFIGNDEDMPCAKQILTACFKPIRATITEIYLSEFFPMRFIASYKLTKKD